MDHYYGRITKMKLFDIGYWRRQLRPKRLWNITVKFPWQRMTQGYSYDQIYSLDHTLARYMLPKLQGYKKHNNGYPSHLTEEEWDRHLDAMIQAMQIIIQEKHILDTEACKKAQYGCELLGKHFLDLWI